MSYSYLNKNSSCMYPGAMHMYSRLHSKFSNWKSTTSRSSMASTLAERWRYHTAIQVYRSVHKISPSYLHNTFHYAAEITGRYAHNKHRLFVPRVRTSLAKNSFYFRGTKIWNSLDSTLYAANKLTHFKCTGHFYTVALCVYVCV